MSGWDGHLMDDLKYICQSGAEAVVLFSQFFDHDATAVDDEDPRIGYAVPRMSWWVVRVQDTEGFDMSMVHVRQQRKLYLILASECAVGVDAVI